MAIYFSYNFSHHFHKLALIIHQQVLAFVTLAKEVGNYEDFGDAYIKEKYYTPNYRPHYKPPGVEQNMSYLLNRRVPYNEMSLK